eukprot:CAMPEP_0119548284 /NCGR_PEP_ID=MMETSP1352-20130426/2230_1 /TAXON_ID=265584 /ORGANISM="Stauroneis constricta, Strain CCMP1120" /LENGTH=188 /DNA_ID=CAMNT_0007593505 /DNA_START=145 /DNA_END=708 /DNA_ORIENTATION=-
MTDENNFFGMAPADDAAAAGVAPADDAGFTMIGDAAPPAEAPPAFAGDMNETMDQGFAAPASGMDDAPDFAAPPADFATPPSDAVADESSAPILLGGPPPDEEPAIAAEDVPEPVEAEPTGPSPMQKWNEEWTQTLQARKDEENSAKAAMIEKAREDLEAFQKKREMAREKRVSKNREDEQAKLEAIE